MPASIRQVSLKRPYIYERSRWRLLDMALWNKGLAGMEAVRTGGSQSATVLMIPPVGGVLWGRDRPKRAAALWSDSGEASGVGSERR